jgi:hypothetical protein
MKHEISVMNIEAWNSRVRYRRTRGGAAVMVLALCLSAQSGMAQQLPQTSSTMQPTPPQPVLQQPMPMQPMQAPGSSSKFLMPLVISALSPVLQAGFGCIFDRLFSFMGANPSPACTQPNQTAVVQLPNNASPSGVNVASINPMPAPQGSENAVQAPPGLGAQTGNAQVLATTPVLSFIVNKLSDATPQATVTQTVQFANVQQPGSNLAFDIRTGESFAILFATSVPGRVRLVNTDVEHHVTASDVYEALPAADNRMPRDWQGGITMAGAKGTETLDVNFTPCISPRYASDPRVTMFQGMLPACSAEVDATPTRATGAKAMVFPSSPTPGQPVGLAPANYAKGEALTFRITINHQ